LKIEYFLMSLRSVFSIIDPPWANIKYSISN
jgi:hypothetical protein